MRALITGISGQDGSFLAELLLSKGYEVWGIIRRNSIPENQTKRIQHLFDKRLNKDFHLLYGDLTDISSLISVIQQSKPDEIYNLAAQSHVRISFDVPLYTAQTTGMGTLNLLEAIRLTCPEARFYQASSSEMFGNNIDSDGYQRETTPMSPVSPYGCAKVFSYNIVRNYRNSYGMHLSNGILFNHECFDANTPIIIEHNGYVDVSYIRSLLPERSNISKDKNELSVDVHDCSIRVWNGESFVSMLTLTRRKLQTLDVDFQKKVEINTRSGVCTTTPNHKFIKSDDNFIRNLELNVATELKHGHYPTLNENLVMLNEEAKLLGYLVGAGYISQDGKSLRFINNDLEMLNRFIDLCKSLFGDIKYQIKDGKSGFGGKSTYVSVSKIPSNVLKLWRSELYDLKTLHKKVPKRILNACNQIKVDFFDTYYECDGLKKDKCVYHYKSFKTNSPLLAQGLLLLFSQISDQRVNINIFENNDKNYYQINFNSPLTSQSGKHLRRNLFEVKKILDISTENCFVYDIETECGVLNAGVGTMIVGNSPRRGENFVTNKVAKCAVEIKRGLKTTLPLGNLDAARDWGHAKDYVKAMEMILKQDGPGDYVCATGVSHTVRDLVKYSFDYLDLDWQKYVVQDEKFLRPEELDVLKGDSIKLQTVTGWKPEYTFEAMIKEMIDFWLDTI